MIRKNLRWMAAILVAANLALVSPNGLMANGDKDKESSRSSKPNKSSGFPTTTPIKHLVVIFQENVSFDHYFGTYPDAQNNGGETPFTALPGTPTVNGL